MLLPFSFEYDLCHVLTSIALPGKCKHLYLFYFSKFRCIGTDGSFPVDFYLILFFRNDTADQRIVFFFDQYGIFRFFIMIIRRQVEIGFCMSVYLIPDLDTAALCPDAASLLSARCRRQPAFQFLAGRQNQLLLKSVWQPGVLPSIQTVPRRQSLPYYGLQCF